jgi:YhcH/YjgK/YiaL family protein
MILDRLENLDLVAGAHAGIAPALAWLRSVDTSKLAPGRHEIDGDRLYAIIDEKPGRGTSGARLEVHHRYIDLQIALVGTDLIGWRPTERCRRPAEPYNADRDIARFADEPEVWLPVVPGDVGVFFPTDGHAPLGADGPLRKLIIKVAAEWK